MDRKTLQFYEDNAKSFVSETVNADMCEARQRFLQQLNSGASILDFGCGSGRDTKAFLEQGYRVDAVDGSSELCRIASEYSGIPVKQMLFQDLDEIERYDGVWACASILHLPKAELKDVLKRIARALKSEGILYTSFKYGNREGMCGGRYFTDFTEEALGAFWNDVLELEIIEQWITQDVRLEWQEERWINLLARRS